jgi:hypothetical protein
MKGQANPNVIDAEPTKDFFIEMLVKDIPLTRAIIDLVDNSVDGALRLHNDGKFDGLWIRIETTDNSFRIADNCGGIPVEVARHYAFRFGRPEGMQSTAGSVGQFGVGMKRAFFKLGSKFKVESTTDVSHFVVEEDVSVWKKKKEWQFQFAKLEEHLRKPPAQARRGTIITITSLHKSVSTSFGLENFLTHLRQELESAHQLNMNRGLAISLNRIPLRLHLFDLLHSDQLKPGYKEMTFEKKDLPPVSVKIFVGLAESNPKDGGWYIFCNGRMVMEADQNDETGWGDGVARYHNQYAMFRGYTFFDSDDAGSLPWNTTKTGVDVDSPIFQSVRLEMISLMRPVITFLNKLKDEKAKKDLEDADNGPLEEALEAATPAQLWEFNAPGKFTAPKPVSSPPTPRTGRIQYSKPLDEINLVKSVLGVDSFREVGEKTFEYFLNMECADNA